MDQWSGDTWTLKAQSAVMPVQRQAASSDPHRDQGGDADSCWYSETFIKEYDGIKVYHHQGRYRHTTSQVHAWAMYEYRMIINSECWNIIMDEDMNNPPASFPGSNSKSLTHDFCHLDSQNSDDVYTNYSFTEMGGRQIWPFYVTESFQQDLWIWVSPRRFAIVSQHPTNEKLNHFYSNKMHEHHILANRTICWVYAEYEVEGGRKKDRFIALSDDARRGNASHETFYTGFEGKYGPKYPVPPVGVNQAKRKHVEPPVAKGVQRSDPTGMYTAQDMQVLDSVFKDSADRHEQTQRRLDSSGPHAEWCIGQVPALGSDTESAANSSNQLAYARKLVSIIAEVSVQFAQVVENLEQLQAQAEGANATLLTPGQPALAKEQSDSTGAGNNQ